MLVCYHQISIYTKKLCLSDRNRRTVNRAAISFDAAKEKPLDCAIDSLVAEMERVLMRRSYLSYRNDHSIPLSASQPGSKPNHASNIFTMFPSSQNHVYAISREVAQSSSEMCRAMGEINKATATMGSEYSIPNTRRQ